MSSLIRILQRFIASAAILTCVAMPATSLAQSNKGKLFYLSFPRNIFFLASPGNPPILNLYIAAEVPTQGSVRVPGLGLEQAFSVVPGSLTQVSLPRGVSDNPTGEVLNRAVIVQAEEEVTVYGLNRLISSTDAFLALPVDVAATKYMVAGHSGLAKPPLTTVVGIYDNTDITIYPRYRSRHTNTTRDGVPFSIQLDSGEIYTHEPVHDANGRWNWEWNTDGTVVESSLPVAVMSGSECVNVPYKTTYCDHLVEQIPPLNTWGRQFLAAPLATRLQGDYFRVLASRADTEVRINGELVASLQEGHYHEMFLEEASTIVTSEPALVTQFATGTTRDGVVADPFMMVVPPVEQFLSSYNFTTLGPDEGFSSGYVNVVTTVQDIGSVVLDGAVIDAEKFREIGTSGYVYAQVQLERGDHILVSAAPAGIYVYGFGDYDSYGYPGGMNFEVINGESDSFKPALVAAHFPDVVEFTAGDSEDINLNQILDEGEDLNGNGVIDRRTEDVNLNGILDPGEDANSNNLLDRDSGIYRISLSDDAENLALDTRGFIPGALRANFSIRPVNTAQRARGVVKVVDGGGNVVEQEVEFGSSAPAFRNVRLVSTLSTDRIELDEESFSLPPDVLERGAGTTRLEWLFEEMSVDALQQLEYEVMFIDPGPDERRVVTYDLEIYYDDINGRPVHQTLGEQSVSVLGARFDASLSASSQIATANQTVVITGSLANHGSHDAGTTYRLEIIDAAGAVVEVLQPEGVAVIPAGGLFALPAVDFNVGDTYQGAYQIRLLVDDAYATGAVEALVPLHVVSGSEPAFSAHVYADKLNYLPGEPVAVTAQVTNLASNQVLEGASATLEVALPDGTLVWSDSHSIPTLNVAARYDYSRQPVLASLPPGMYRVMLRVMNEAGELRASSQYAFELLSTQSSGAGLLATLGVEPARVLRTEKAVLSATLRNAGNSDLVSVPMQSQVADIDAQQTLASWNLGDVSLQQGQQQRIELPWTANAPAAGASMILTGTFSGEEKVLASQMLVLDEKFSSSVLLQGKGRLLVLVDAAPVDGKQCNGLAEIGLSVKPGVLLAPGDQFSVELRDATSAVIDSEIISVDYGVMEHNENQSLVDEMAVWSVNANDVGVRIAPGMGVERLSGGHYTLHYAVTRHGVMAASGFAELNTACGGMTAGEMLSGNVQVVQVYGPDEPEPHGPGAAPGTLVQQRALQSVLERLGWQADVVVSADAFQDELSRNRHSIAVLLGEQVKLSAAMQATLAEKVSAGMGLVVAGMHDNRNKEVADLLGIKLAGVYSDAERVATQPPLSGQSRFAALAFDEKPLRIRLQGAEPIADFLSGERLLGAAATRHRAGQGQTIFFAFDLAQRLAAENAVQAWSDWLGAALDAAHPDPEAFGPGSITPVTVMIENVGAPTSGTLHLQLPANVALVDAGGGQLQADNTLYRALALPSDAPSKWTFSIRLPDAVTPVLLNGVLRVLDAEGELVDYGLVQGTLDTSGQ